MSSTKWGVVNGWNINRGWTTPLKVEYCHSQSCRHLQRSSGHTSHLNTGEVWMFNGLGIPAVTPLMSYTSKTFRGNEKLFFPLPSTLAALSFHINEAGGGGNAHDTHRGRRTQTTHYCSSSSSSRSSVRLLMLDLNIGGESVHARLLAVHTLQNCKSAAATLPPDPDLESCVILMKHCKSSWQSKQKSEV